MKKMLIYFCTLVLSASLITGCGENPNSNQHANNPTVSDSAKQTTASKPATPISIQDKIKIENVEKFSVPEAYSEKEGFALSFKVINNTDKPIAGVQLKIKVKSQFGDVLRNLKCDIDSDIPAHGYVIFNDSKTRFWSTNQFNAQQCKALDTPAEKLRFDFIVAKIVYSDGTLDENNTQN